MLVKTYTAALVSVDAHLVTVEVNVEPGAAVTLVGLPDTSVKESYQRIETAAEYSGYRLHGFRSVINLSPGDLKKEGTAYDLPIAIGLIGACQYFKSTCLDRYVMVGELSLDGTIRPVKGALPIAIKARELGFEGLIVPRENAREAAVVNKLKVFAADTLVEVVHFLEGTGELDLVQVDTRAEFEAHREYYVHDFADVKGQENVKRAMEVAAAGGHNILMVGAPGSGKSMMAKRVPGILPPFTLGESLETTKIYSVAGKLAHNTTLMTARPFRAPHHSISMPALVGGGTSPRPGEISLAHNGVLFLDELAEFNRSVLELMRQPMEERTITVSRAKATVDYPASFMLVAAMNPCPCGLYGDTNKECTCSSTQIINYQRKLSGPLMDRIDMVVNVEQIHNKELISSSSSSSYEHANAKKQIDISLKLQHKRYNCSNLYNSMIKSSDLKNKFSISPEAENLLNLATSKLNLSARSYLKILKVSRTIADLDSSKDIKPSYISEALQYRQKNDFQ